MAKLTSISRPKQAHEINHPSIIFYNFKLENISTMLMLKLPPKQPLKFGLTFLVPLLASVCLSHLAFAGDDDDMEEVLITSSRTNSTLDDTPLRLEVLGEEELGEKANMKPGDIRMILNESTGIQVQQTSATSFNSSIRIQGVDGRYTQLLRDGLPIYSGFSGSLSLLQVTPLDLQQVEVIKGASSTLYGGGAIAGLINLISKTPDEEPETAFMVNATSAQGADASAFHSRELGKHGLTLFGSYNKSEAYDPADNGLSAIPEFERITLTPRWFYALSDNTHLNFGVGLIDEDRLGGSIDYIEGRNTTEYFESNESRRTYTRFGFDHEFGGGIQLEIKNTNSWFDRRLEIPNFIFSGEQISSFSEITFAGGKIDVSWVAGVNLISDEFKRDTESNGLIDDHTEETIGVFGQYTWDIAPSLVLETGLRVDDHSDYGNFLLPRLSLLILPADDLSLRIGGGYGYKTPTPFIAEAEEIHFQNLAPIDPDVFKAETSKGLNFDINYLSEFSDDFSLTSNVLFFYTQIDDGLQIIESNNAYQFDQLKHAIDSRGVESNLVFNFGELKYLLGYTYVDARQKTDSGYSNLTLISPHRVNQVLMWEKEDDFRIGLEAYYYSEQERENDTPGESYWFWGLMMEKTLNKQVAAFLNFENFTDSRQTKRENINAGDLVNPVFRDIYAPLDGFVINGGVKVRF